MLHLPWRHRYAEDRIIALKMLRQKHARTWKGSKESIEAAYGEEDEAGGDFPLISDLFLYDCST